MTKGVTLQVQQAKKASVARSFSETSLTQSPPALYSAFSKRNDKLSETGDNLLQARSENFLCLCARTYKSTEFLNSTFSAFNGG